MANIKLTVIEYADYEAVKEFCEFAKSRGYKVTVADNGNFIFQKEEAQVQEIRNDNL